MTINLEVYSVPFGRTGESRDVALSDLSDDVLRYCLEYGLRQSANDAGANALMEAFAEHAPEEFNPLNKAIDKAKADKNKAAVDKARLALSKAAATWKLTHDTDVAVKRVELINARIDRLLSGDVPEAGAPGGLAYTPLEEETFKLAKAHYLTGKSKEVRKEFNARTKAAQREAIESYVDIARETANVDFVREAQASLDAKRDLKAKTAELSEIKL